MSRPPLLLTILGPTATGKTALACEVARRTGGEVISADSRQVFRGLDIGTGKDLADYRIGDSEIPYHLIDICDPREEYNAYRFVGDFSRAFDDIVRRGKMPILCGGTGLYVDAVVRGYEFPEAPIDEAFRKEMEAYSDEALTRRLASYIKLHNHTDTESRDRLLRALEIEEYRRAHPNDVRRLPMMRHRVYGVAFEREEIIGRIGQRLDSRLHEGMVEEVRRLIDEGVPAERLLRLGLEYRHLTLYITGQCSYEEMREHLFTDIRRFAKRQMTWFRRMERMGVEIVWIDGRMPLEQKAEMICRGVEADRG